MQYMNNKVDSCELIVDNYGAHNIVMDECSYFFIQTLNLQPPNFQLSTNNYKL